jgi:hypothetical protein
MRLTVISFGGSSVAMLYELLTLVATAGSTNRPVLQARDRDPLHQHQVKQNDKKCGLTNGYDTRHLSTDYLLVWIGLNTHQKLLRAATYPIPILSTPEHKTSTHN